MTNALLASLPQVACPGHFLDVYEPIDGVTFVSESEATSLIRSARGGGGVPHGNTAKGAAASSARSGSDDVYTASDDHQETEYFDTNITDDADSGDVVANTVGRGCKGQGAGNDFVPGLNPKCKRT